MHRFRSLVWFVGERGPMGFSRFFYFPSAGGNVGEFSFFIQNKTCGRESFLVSENFFFFFWKNGTLFHGRIHSELDHQPDGLPPQRKFRKISFLLSSFVVLPHTLRTFTLPFTFTFWVF